MCVCASVPINGVRHSIVAHGQFLLGMRCVLLLKNNFWGFIVVLVMFSSLQSLAWIVFFAIFLSYQPYNFIVITVGMSLDTHPNWRLCCWADCPLICRTSGFRHFLVRFCLFFLAFEMLYQKIKPKSFHLNPPLYLQISVHVEACFL